MAALTVVGSGKREELLETIAITDQTADSTAVTKAVSVPTWAKYATFTVKLTMTGTTPTFDFIIKALPGGVAPDGDNVVPLGGWDGITQKTGATASFTTIAIGPDAAVDDSGSATASDHYSVQATLPPWLAYTYTTTGADDDEDYAGTIRVQFSE